MTNAITSLLVLLASGLSNPTLLDIFDGREPREVLASNLTAAEAERCIVASGVSAYPVRLESDPPETVFFLTLQTLSGRNPPAWRLIATNTGSSIEIYDDR